MAHEREVEIPAGQSREWNFHPDLPISMSPVFDVPPKPAKAIGWLLGTWIKLTPPVNHLLFAIVCTSLFLPSMQTMHTQVTFWSYGRSLSIFFIKI